MKKYKCLKDMMNKTIFRNIKESFTYTKEELIYCDIPALIKDGYISEIIEPKEIIEYLDDKLIRILYPTPQTRSILNGKRYEYYISTNTKMDIEAGSDLLNDTVKEETNYFRHKITIISEEK